MKLPSIVAVPHPALRRELAPVTVFDNALADLAEVMIATMHKGEGVGLAANQIDRPERMFVYGIDEPLEFDDEKVEPVAPMAIVNPSITILDDKQIVDEEGCLSIPGLYGPVARPWRIRIDGQDVTGKSISKDLSGYEARIVQHETDHLNGILFLDRLTDPGKLRRAK